MVKCVNTGDKNIVYRHHHLESVPIKHVVHERTSYISKMFTVAHTRSVSWFVSKKNAKSSTLD